MQNMDRVDKIDDIEVVDVSNGNVVPTMKNCRAVLSDTGGDIRVDQKCDWEGTTKQQVISIPAQIWMQYGNIVRVYQYLVDTTETDSQVLDSNNDTVNGIKLGR